MDHDRAAPASSGSAVFAESRSHTAELADAIDNDTRCKDCGGFVSDDGMSIDPDKCCFYCSLGN